MGTKGRKNVKKPKQNKEKKEKKKQEKGESKRGEASLIYNPSSLGAEKSLRGAERRSKLKDKDKIASPLARNDTSVGSQ